ncbi:MAG: DUF4403 family protein, partial [Gemmatimonadota bacterium]|nr:DUF4403 family protein [Gemmatimonadota bacterium]
MRSPSVRHMFPVWSLALFMAGCSFATLPIRPSEPEQLPPARNPDFSVTDSVINVPVRADLTPFLTAANDERVIAKTFDHWQSYVKGAKGVDYKYYAEREDFSMTPPASGVSSRLVDSAVLRDWWKGVDRAANVSLSAPLRYKIGTSAHAGSGSGPLQCGDGGQWPKRAAMYGDVSVDMTPDYGLTASVAGLSVNPVDPCALEVAGVDVAREAQAKLAEMARGGMNEALKRITTVTFKQQVEEAWNVLRNPIPLKPGVWLMLNVEHIGHSGFSGQG